jgi:hypothetical protein
MIEGKTSSGFEYKVSPGIAYDVNFIRASVKMRKKDMDPEGRAEAAFAMIDSVFSGDDDQIERLMQHLARKSDNGRTDVRELIREVNEIVSAIMEVDDDVKKQ